MVLDWVTQPGRGHTGSSKELDGVTVTMSLPFSPRADMSELNGILRTNKKVSLLKEKDKPVRLTTN